MSEVIIIAAVSKNDVIGKDGKMPWNLKADLARFKELTLNHTIIMGRKTYESLPVKPLKNRINIVLTSNKDFKKEGVITKNSLKEAIDYAKESKDSKVYLIGGQKVYEEGMAYADTLEITKINKDYDGDAIFPKIDLKTWKLEAVDGNDEYSYLTYIRK